MHRKNSKSLSSLLILSIFILKTTEVLTADSGETAADGYNGNEDVYDPVLLEQDVLSQEQNNSLQDDMDKFTMHNESDTSPSDANETLIEFKKAQPSEMQGQESSERTTTTQTPTPQTLPTTTLVPDYVRQAKSHHAFDVELNNESNASSSADYYEDDDESLEHTKHEIEDALSSMPVQSSLKANNDQDAAVMPTASAINNVIEAPSQSVNETEESVHSLEEPAALSARNSSDEEYYDESLAHDISEEREDAIRQLNPTTTNAPQPEEPIVFVQRAGFDFPRLPFMNRNMFGTKSVKDLSTTTPTTTSTTTTPLPKVTTNSPLPTTTTNRPSTKQGKQINITRRKLLPHEQLQNYVEDAYIRTPLAVIVDPSPITLEKTKELWNAALSKHNINIKMVLVSLNASGNPAAFSFNNTRQFLAGLNSIKENEGGDPLIGVVQSAELVPYDSAIFLSTASIPPYSELVQDAAITLLKKRIRLYVIWYGEHSLTENETQDAVGGILGEVALRSGGEVLLIVGPKNSQEIEGTTSTIIADALRGSQEIDIPVDSSLSSLHVKIDAPMKVATLDTPSGAINLKKFIKLKSPQQQEQPNLLANDSKRLDVYIPLTKIQKSKVLKLKLKPVTDDIEYTVFIRSERKPDLFLDDVVNRLEQYFMRWASPFTTMQRNQQPQLRSLPSQTHAALTFPEESSNDSTETENMPKKEIETFSDVEIHANPPTTTKRNITLRSDMVAMPARNILKQCGPKIEMSTQSQLIVAPGSRGSLVFEITNVGCKTEAYNIRVVDEKSYLLSLQPQSFILGAEQTAIVTVAVTIPPTAVRGTVDRITFSAQGRDSTADQASLNVNLKVANGQETVDNTLPTLDWKFGSRCDYVAADAANCMDRFWLLDITAQDWQSGIVRIQSSPLPLIYRDSYTVGSTEPLRATYIASCCEPKATLTAYDAVGNQRSYNIDAHDFVWDEPWIVAIVLGSLLLLLVIVLIIVGIVWCCRKRKNSLDLPTYRSHSSRSME